MIRVGFLGCGFIADVHAGLLATCGEPFSLVSAYDRDPQRSGAFAERWSTTAAASEAEVVDACDAVFVCTWTSEHAALVAQAAARGRHVFCEKPLAFDAGEAARMAGTVQDAGVVHMVGLILRAAPAMLALRAMVNEALSGRIMSIVFRDDQYIPIQGMYASDWRADPARAGRGVLLEHSIHDIDILEWLAGPIESVFARQEFFHEMNPIEDSVHALLTLRSGATATLATTWHDITSRPSQRRIEVFCENALYTLEGEWFGPLHWQRVIDGEQSEGSLEGDALTRWLRDRGIEQAWPESLFLRAIRDGGKASPDFGDAVRAHRIVDAIYRSCASGEVAAP